MLMPSQITEKCIILICDLNMPDGTEVKLGDTNAIALILKALAEKAHSEDSEFLG